MKNNYEFTATVLEVYDGDTVTLLISLPFNIYLKEKARLFGIDTPEIRTKNKEEKKAGYKTRDYLRTLILGKEVQIKTEKEGKFGRYLVDIYLEDGTHINKLLIDKGLAKEYYGGKKEKYT